MKKIIDIINNYKLEVFTITFLFAAFIFIGVTINHCVHNIDEVGGLRTVVVESGKEIKSIIKDINEE